LFGPPAFASIQPFALMFIPFRLEKRDAPEYAFIAFNVLFSASKVVEGKLTVWTELHEPDSSL
jgi:hypothetical protein